MQNLLGFRPDGARMNDEQELMSQIRAKYGAAIRAATQGIIYPEAFIAALTANESGGVPTATRIEPQALADLAGVLLGKTTHFGAITGASLMGWIEPDPIDHPRKAKDGVLALVNLATSWGPTQIMGYQALAGGYALSELTQIGTHYERCVQVLDGFRKEWNLAVADALFNPEPFFRCWNSGSPDGKTFDPNYVPRGLNRMNIYRELP